MTECQEYQAQLSAHLDEALAEDEARALDEHLAGCTGCRAEREALAQVTEQVRALPRLEIPAHFTASVMAKVLEAPPAKKRKRLVPIARAVKSSDGDVPNLVQLPGAEEEDAKPDADTGKRAPSPCEALAEDRSALIDNAIQGKAATRVKAHLADCKDCQADQAALQRLRDQVGALTPMPIPPDFVQGVMDKVDAYEFQRLQRAQEKREERARWYQTLSRVAQVAGFLLVVAVGMVMASPDAPRLQRNVKRDHNPERIAWPGMEKGRTIRPPKRPVLPPLPRAEAQWELSVASLDAGPQTVRRLLVQYTGTRPQERKGERSHGFLVNVPRNRIDDLHRALEQAEQVETNGQSREVMEEFHTEQDQVVLKSGFVLVGQLRRQNRATVQIQSGGALRTLARKDVERVERAGERKQLRILLHPHQRD